jgi:hypothetical protein
LTHYLKTRCGDVLSHQVAGKYQHVKYMAKTLPVPCSTGVHPTTRVDTTTTWVYPHPVPACISTTPACAAPSVPQPAAA